MVFSLPLAFLKFSPKSLCEQSKGWLPSGRRRAVECQIQEGKWFRVGGRLALVVRASTGLEGVQLLDKPGGTLEQKADEERVSLWIIGLNCGPAKDTSLVLTLTPNSALTPKASAFDDATTWGLPLTEVLLFHSSGSSEGWHQCRRDEFLLEAPEEKVACATLPAFGEAQPSLCSSTQGWSVSASAVTRCCPTSVMLVRLRIIGWASWDPGLRYTSLQDSRSE